MSPDDGDSHGSNKNCFSADTGPNLWGRTSIRSRYLDGNYLLGVPAHSQSGVEMINAALDQSNNIKILAVSLLTSLDKQDVSRLYDNDFEKQFEMLLKVITDTKTHGIVCSSHELVKISDNNLIKVVPGIRNVDVSDDQKRIMSSKAAYANGADFIVVGLSLIHNSEPTRLLSNA